MNIAFRRFKPAFGIATRLALGIGALLALLALVAALGWHGLREGARAHSEAQVEVALGLSVIQVASALQAMRRYEKDVFLSLDQTEVVAGYRKRWQESRDDMRRAYEAARDLARNREDASRLRRLKPSMAAYEAGFDEAINAHARGDLATGPQARAQMSLLQASADIVEEQSLELAREAAGRIDGARRALEGDARRGQVVLLGLSGLAIAIAALVGWLITRSVTAPLAVATRLVRLTSQGDLTARPTQGASGEIGRLVSDIAGMNEALAGIVGDVRARARAVDEGAAGIQRGNRELSQRTESQATALEQTAAAVGAFSAAVRENADATASADTVAREASEMARQAGNVTDALLDRFQAIEESSRRITEITSLVERIAFQTNILALNAAIEAARAGEAGRGFSVVAAEVRRLSQGTAEAAHQITALVEAAVRSVAEGGRHAADTGAAIEGVAGRIEVLTRSMSGIAVATREQRASVGQISQALSQLDAATQENARLADRSTEAAGALESVAAELVDAVSRFQVEPQQAPAAATEKSAPGMARGVPNGPLEGARPTLLLSPRRSFPHRCA